MSGALAGLVRAFGEGLIVENLAAALLMALGYVVLCVLLPAVCLHWRVAERDLVYRLAYYQVWGFLYLIAVSFALSYTHLYGRAALFVALVAVPLAARAYVGRKGLKAWALNLVGFARAVAHGEYNARRTRKSLLAWVRQRLGSAYAAYVRGHVLTYAFWLALAAFIVLYFGYFKLHYASYAMTDEETHLYWIQSLINGEPFPKGLYPHGEHFLVGAIVVLLDVQVVRCWLAFSIVSTLMIFSAAYLFFRTLFSSRAAVLFALGLFLVADVTWVTTYYRYQYCVPMEPALTAMFLMLLGLVRYMGDRTRQSLLLFGGGLALTFQIHFYVTIFSFVLLVGYALVYAVPAFRRGVLHKIVLCAVVSMVLSLVPFGVGLALGYPFERSIDWAMAIMTGGDSEATLYQDEADDGQAVEGQPAQSDQEKTEKEKTEEELEQERYKAWTRDRVLAARTPEQVVDVVAMLLNRALVIEWEYGRLYALAVGLIGLYGVAGTLWCAVRKKEGVERFQAYLAYAVSWLAGMFVYAMSFVGLPEVIHATRAAIFLYAYSIGLYAIVVQIAFDVLKLIPVKPARLDAALCVLAACGLGCYLQVGPVKDISKLYYNFAIQSADMQACEAIMDTRQPFTWTVVSPVNDLSAIRYDGYHYEIIDLLTEIEDGKEEIYIPTPEIFVVVENRIASYGAGGDYRQVDGSDYYEKSNPVSPKQAMKTYDELGLDNLASRDRAYYDLRGATMSKLYYWMEKIKRVYPVETSVYLDDGYCTVYRIRQDPYFLLNLSVDYSDVIQEALEAAS